MTQSKTVVLFPPRLELSPLTNKYDFIFTLKWGEYERVIKINKEVGGAWNNLLRELNNALLEGSEAKPYILK
jgi:hypothetical protein